MPQAEDFTPVKAESYKDEDLVYVDPQLRLVVGFVEWSNSGKPKALLMKDKGEVDDDEDESAPISKPGAVNKVEPKAEEKAPAAAPVAGKPVPKGFDKGRIRRKRVRYYPWGTYRSMKRIYKIEGKVRNDKDENRKTLDEVLEKALKEPFWD